MDKKKIYLILAAFLAVIMTVSVMGLPAFAKEVINGNDWYGDEVAVENITAGQNGYNYMALFRKPVHGYEFSGHFMGEGEGPQNAEEGGLPGGGLHAPLSQWCRPD